jgi:hypothetical protein
LADIIDVWLLEDYITGCFYRIKKPLSLLLDCSILYRRRKMSDETERGKPFVRVRDGAGNDWLCPLETLVDPKDASEEELNSCVDDATVGRYAGDINIVD